MYIEVEAKDELPEKSGNYTVFTFLSTMSLSMWFDKPRGKFGGADYTHSEVDTWLKPISKEDYDRGVLEEEFEKLLIYGVEKEGTIISQSIIDDIRGFITEYLNKGEN